MEYDSNNSTLSVSRTPATPPRSTHLDMVYPLPIQMIVWARVIGISYLKIKRDMHRFMLTVHLTELLHDHPVENPLGLGLGRGFGTYNNGPDCTVDEATFSSVSRSADWLTASYHNQKPNSDYLDFGNLLGPISLDDPTGTEVYGKKDTNMTHAIAFSGSGSFSARVYLRVVDEPATEL